MNTHTRLPLLVVISGPSGAGKSIILKRLLERSARYSKIPSITTEPAGRRKARDIEYKRVSEQRFKELQNDGAFLESAQVHGYWFGTLKDDVARIASSKKIPLKIIDVQGFAQIRALRQFRLCSIFITAQTIQELKRRIIEREPTIAKIVVDERLVTARKELKQANQYDAVVINRRDQIEEAVDQIEAVIDKCIQNA